MTNFESVKKFMQTFGQEVKIKASFPSEKIVSLRIDLINEELTEFAEKTIRKDLDTKMKGASEKSSQGHQEKMFSDMERYSSFEN